MTNEQGSDRRVQRTRRLLHGALASLIHEKSYDDIVVKEILARADVGRSTFYTHYRDKDDLLASGMRQMLRASARAAAAPGASAADHVLRFSLPLLEHIGQFRRDGEFPMDADGQAIVHEQLRRALVELVADDLRRVAPRACRADAAVPASLLAEHVATTFVVVLGWWMERDTPLSPRQANDAFRGLVLPGLREAIERT